MEAGAREKPGQQVALFGPGGVRNLNTLAVIGVHQGTLSDLWSTAAGQELGGDTTAKLAA